ncbi:MAG: acyl-CoA dehydratase activase [Rikenellaceae bacterium]|nr:acyl-CoA dehydratase activase [Rikenellaceae bacterium]
MAYKIGLDVGSTTAKLVMTDQKGDVVFSKYERHQANVSAIVKRYFEEIAAEFGDCEASVTITGSVGMGLAEKCGVDFVQEVVAATELVKKEYPDISTIIDIGGEDAKIVYINHDGAVDLRMNGNCAGGTGAFIDQMAILLGVDVDQLDMLARQAKNTYHIASRCGVFSKTDVQNLISKNVSKADVAASIFHAVAVQTVVTLSHGCSIEPKILFCGGPLTFIPSLRRAFIDYLKLDESNFTTPENANIIPAWGAALCNKGDNCKSISQIMTQLSAADDASVQKTARLKPIFDSPEQYRDWREAKQRNVISQASLADASGNVYLGVDSGSTTTKIVVIDDKERIVYTHYTPNRGNPIKAVRQGLEALKERCAAEGVTLRFKGGCSTGYGEDLIKAAFKLDDGIIETVAHYVAARKLNPQVSFILDIGGQDMKAMFVEGGVLTRMELNEACSSGCGSFIETFAKSLGYTVDEFADEACMAKEPCDLGTRCTVFMNSKVKQVLREGATVGDIAAGLSYSVVKNCLYKVLKLRKRTELGDHIVVQGGTMRNDSVVRALELLVDTDVSRSDMPELMGAYGCALNVKAAQPDGDPVSLDRILATVNYDTRQMQCHGCENKCLIYKYMFENGNIFYSGNKCEKIFSNQGEKRVKGANLYTEKYAMLFDREPLGEEVGGMVIGLPRCLNMYEDYPFWHTLFKECGIRTVLSSPSTYRSYEAGIHTVMSDNICFPAKLAHSHIYDLIARKVDRIFFPYVIFEKLEDKAASNSYNCPIVSGYSDVLRSVAGHHGVAIDSPVITFKDRGLLAKECRNYLSTLGISDSVAQSAVKAAIAEQERYEEQMQKRAREIYLEGSHRGKVTILLAGRPYHTDPLIQHKLSDMVSDMGVNVITEDIVRNSPIPIDDAHIVSQWAYINRILRAAKWVAMQGGNVHFVQMTSFGCGPDAFLLDEVRSMLKRYGKSLTLLKIDDVTNIGSIKLRVRSIVDSLKYSCQPSHIDPFITTKSFQKEDKGRKIIAPYFTDYFSPLLHSLFKLAGYEAETLPQSNVDSAEFGLRYANNEVCYPATLVVGDIIKALKSGKYDLDKTAVTISQTGGQCRATNYITLIKRAMVEAGFENVPIVSLAVGNGLINEQPGFKINWWRIAPMLLAATIFGDCISKFYHSAVVREVSAGAAKRLRDNYLEAVKPLIESNNRKAVYDMIAVAAKEFNDISEHGKPMPKVGIVGEIFLKFNAFANKDVAEWLIGQGIEVEAPTLLNFFLQSFVNHKINIDAGLKRKSTPMFVSDMFYSLIRKQVEKVNKLASAFEYFTPFADIFDEAKLSEGIVTPAAQFGEGWLLPSEIISFAKHGVNNVVSLQPFGCIANQVISKGVEKKIKSLYPQMNILSLDFDSGVSDVNVTNRLLLFINGLKQAER